jgi:cation diffusion facilitator CzcD-associated flavoprotein CzcO
VHEDTRCRVLLLLCIMVKRNSIQQGHGTMLDWLIIGGGIQGTALTFYLVQRRRVQRDGLRILDPHDRLLARWREMTASVGMDYLRSPGVHHLHDDPWSLQTFAQTQAGQSLARYIPVFHRPSLDLFNAHSAALIERARLQDLHLQAWAQGLHRLENGEGWRVQTSAGDLEARRVVLAISPTEQPYWPEWAVQMREQGAAVAHIFENDFRRQSLLTHESIVVLGGGITAAQAALALAREKPGAVTLLMRHDIRLSNFDSDPCWVTRLCLDEFYATSNLSERRAIIRRARQRGSMPTDVAEALAQGVESGLLRVIVGEVTQAQNKAGEIALALNTGADLTADALLLATGFDPKRPGGAWLDAAIAENDLPTAPDGYPVVDSTLCWAPGLHVMGALAELEIGPTARNFIGARLAVARIGTAI